jgi:hypothetical protein
MDSEDLDALDEHEFHIAEVSDDGQRIELDLDSLWDMSL